MPLLVAPERFEQVAELGLSFAAGRFELIGLESFELGKLRQFLLGQVDFLLLARDVVVQPLRVEPHQDIALLDLVSFPHVDLDDASAGARAHGFALRVDQAVGRLKRPHPARAANDEVRIRQARPDHGCGHERDQEQRRAVHKPRRPRFQRLPEQCAIGQVGHQCATHKSPHGNRESISSPQVGDRRSIATFAPDSAERPIQA